VTGFIKIAELKDMPSDMAIMVEVEGKEVALFRVNGAFCAISAMCSHREGPLHQGLVEGNTVTCPWHFAKFDLKSGEALTPPAPSGVQTYEVRVEGNDIKIAKP